MTIDVYEGDRFEFTVSPDPDGVVVLFDRRMCEGGPPLARVHVDRPLVLRNDPWCPDASAHRDYRDRPREVQVSWRWGKWTFGLWTDRGNHTILGLDLGPLEVAWRSAGYRP